MITNLQALLLPCCGFIIPFPFFEILLQIEEILFTVMWDATESCFLFPSVDIAFRLILGTKRITYVFDENRHINR